MKLRYPVLVLIVCLALWAVCFPAAGSAEDRLSLWQLIDADCGYSIQSAGAKGQQALEYYGGLISTYRLSKTSTFLFNFYEVTDEKGK